MTVKLNNINELREIDSFSGNEKIIVSDDGNAKSMTINKVIPEVLNKTYDAVIRYSGGGSYQISEVTGSFEDLKVKMQNHENINVFFVGDYDDGSIEIYPSMFATLRTGGESIGIETWMSSFSFESDGRVFVS